MINSHLFIILQYISPIRSHFQPCVWKFQGNTSRQKDSRWLRSSIPQN